MRSAILNGLRTYAPSSREELIQLGLTKKGVLVAINAEKIVCASEDFKKMVNRNIGYPDGIGAIMALKNKGVDNVTKIPGVELWLDIIRLHYKNKTFYLVGGKESVIQKTVNTLRNDFPGIQIANFRNGYVESEAEKEALLADIQETKPDVVFVAMGSPKQEMLMEEMHRAHPALYQGLGGSFDVYTGNVERAPDWWIRNNLEWAFRLLKQPTRIKRQIHYLNFMYKLKTNQL